MNDHLSLPVGRNAAHVIVDRRQHRDRLLGDVHAGEDVRRLRNARQSFLESCRRQMMQLQVNVIFLWANAPARLDLESH